MPPERTKESATDLSALMALARVKNKEKLSHARVLKTMRTPWAKSLGVALIDEEEEKKLSSELSEDLQSIRQLAGVAE